MRVRVSFVMQLLDDFTDQVILDGSIQIWAGEFHKPICKPDGYYVFMDVPEAGIVTISSRFYNTEVIRIGKRENPNQVVKVRLKPDRRYLLPEGTTCVSGKAPAKSRIGIVLEREESSWKLLYDYLREKEPLNLQLFNPTGQNLEGRWFVIMEREEKHRETFQIERYQAEENGYMLVAPLSADYRKPGTKIYSFQDTQADEQGNFFLPIKERIREHTPCCFYIEDEMSVGILEPGRMNQRDF